MGARELGLAAAVGSVIRVIELEALVGGIVDIPMRLLQVHGLRDRLGAHRRPPAPAAGGHGSRCHAPAPGALPRPLPAPPRCPGSRAGRCRRRTRPRRRWSLRRRRWKGWCAKAGHGRLLVESALCFEGCHAVLHHGSHCRELTPVRALTRALQMRHLHHASRRRTSSPTSPLHGALACSAAGHRRSDDSLPWTGAAPATVVSPCLCRSRCSWVFSVSS